MPSLLLEHLDELLHLVFQSRDLSLPFLELNLALPELLLSFCGQTLVLFKLERDSIQLVCKCFPLVLILSLLYPEPFVLLSKLSDIIGGILQSSFKLFDLAALLPSVLLVVSRQVRLRLLLLDHV